MVKKQPKRKLVRWLTFAEYRKEAFGPIQFQFLIIAVFFLPLVVKLAYAVGLPRPESLWVRVLISLTALAGVLTAYRTICHAMDIPMFRGKEPGDSEMRCDTKSAGNK